MGCSVRIFKKLNDCVISYAHCMYTELKEATFMLHGNLLTISVHFTENIRTAIILNSANKYRNRFKMSD